MTEAGLNNVLTEVALGIVTLFSIVSTAGFPSERAWRKEWSSKALDYVKQSCDVSIYVQRHSELVWGSPFVDHLLRAILLTKDLKQQKADLSFLDHVLR